MHQRLCNQVVATVQARRAARAKQDGCLAQAVDHLFGWQTDVFVCLRPGEWLLCDQVLSSLVQDAIGESREYLPLSKTLSSLMVHQSYGTDFEIPPPSAGEGKKRIDPQAEMVPIGSSPQDRWVRDFDPETRRIGADVYATIHVRQKTTQLEGKLFYFASFRLNEKTPGRFQWDRVAATREFEVEPKKPTEQHSSTLGRPR